jgi:DNA-binding CsgD family transcriptional regulator
VILHLHEFNALLILTNTLLFFSKEILLDGFVKQGLLHKIFKKTVGIFLSTCCLIHVVVMSNFLNYENLLSSIIKTQSHLYAKSTNSSVSSFKDIYINEFSRNENIVKIIFDQKQFKIIYISDNVETLSGYLSNDFLQSDMLFVLKLFTLEHATFIYNWLNWAISVHQKLGNLSNSKQTICGIKLKHKDGRMMSLILRYSAIERAESGVAKVTVISVEDITHLVRSDFYWGRLEQRHEKGTNTHHFLSTDKKDNPHDIISDREKGVLRLLAEGKESKEIGDLLFISHHTVDNHRRSMIAKIGVKDTTGLIQICKMAGII